MDELTRLRELKASQDLLIKALQGKILTYEKMMNAPTFRNEKNGKAYLMLAKSKHRYAEEVWAETVTYMAEDGKVCSRLKDDFIMKFEKL